ncbi:TetR/AcrR family transcriptional regulator [Bordetella tumulicola]|uniref:TetR/AcrR family transcriptional regulator n=1 Tax=Bordetella tumulicola TaxID=1649133 RepID=UPI0039EF75FE
MSPKTKSKVGLTPPKPPKTRQRLSPAEREQQILSGAISFFSRHGLDGQTRELAKEIGITHPLLYHYFPTKKALIERVYQEVYLGRWNKHWEDWLDAPTELEEKLNSFYQAYAKAILTPEWVRILIFSGLSDGYIPNKYISLLQSKLLPRIARETRNYLGLQHVQEEDERITQLIWGLHSGIFYLGIQQWIYGLPAPQNIEQIIKDRVRAYIVSARDLFGHTDG